MLGGLAQATVKVHLGDLGTWSIKTKSSLKSVRRAAEVFGFSISTAE